DVERTVPERDAVRRVEPAHDRDHTVRAHAAATIEHRVDGAAAVLPRADEYRSVGRERHRARAGHMVGVDGNRKSLRKLQLVELRRSLDGLGAEAAAPLLLRRPRPFYRRDPDDEDGDRQSDGNPSGGPP